LNYGNKCQNLTPGITACLGSSKYNIQMNVRMCLPQIWGFMWGVIENGSD